MIEMTVERLAERGKAITAWEAAGGDVDALIDLDQAVRHHCQWVSEWPGERGSGGAPRRRWVCSRCTEHPFGPRCHCWDDPG